MSDREYGLYIDGRYIEVTEEVYQEYKRAEEKEKYFMKRLKRGKAVMGEKGEEYRYIPSREISYEQFLGRNGNIPASGESVEDAVLRRKLLERLEEALHSLSDEELELIQKLFYLEKTEREIGAAYHVSQAAVHKRKKRILKKLRSFFE